MGVQIFNFGPVLQGEAFQTLKIFCIILIFSKFRERKFEKTPLHPQCKRLFTTKLMS